MSWVLCGLDWVANKRDPPRPPQAVLRGRHPVVLRSATPARGPCPTATAAGIRSTSSTRRSAASSARAPSSWRPPATTHSRRHGGGRPAIDRSSRSRPWPTSTAGPAARATSPQACHAGAALGAGRPVRIVLVVRRRASTSSLPASASGWRIRGKSYARVSGTSFAAPMVLGAALLYRKRYPSAQPNQVRMALIYSGRHDWRLSSDPDQTHEPKVDVRHFAPPPTFTYSQPSRRTIRRGGDTVHRHACGRIGSMATRPASGSGPTDAPHGVHVTIDGSHVTIHARASADTGRRTVTLRASDGEVERTIRIPIRVTRGAAAADRALHASSGPPRGAPAAAPAPGPSRRCHRACS